jgi:amino acid transporter
MVSFLSCTLSLQAAASRLLFSFARDGMIPGSSVLKKLSPSTKVPTNALFVTGLIPIFVASIGHVLQDAVSAIISFASVGIYIGFQMVVIAALRARLKGWEPSGSFSLGKWGSLINSIALFYGTTAIINMVYPRSPTEPWFIDYGMIFSSIIVIGTGMLYLFIFRPDNGKSII